MSRPMFDHVDLRTADLSASARAYRPLLRVLGAEPISEEEDLVDWGELGLALADAENPVTRHVHVGLLARDAATIDAFWRRGRDAGLPDDGAPGPRDVYGEGYVGAFLRDLDGNSIEACRHPNSVDGSLIDHVWLRVRDVAASTAFYAAVSPHTGFGLVHEQPGYARFRGPGASFSLAAGTPVSEHLHLAFPATEDATVDAFHAAALTAGGRENGPPGERAHYHPGYYGAFVLDPDGHNVEVVCHNR